jgi:hypothetical protein
MKIQWKNIAHRAVLIVGVSLILLCGFSPQLVFADCMNVCQHQSDQDCNACLRAEGW